MPRARKPTEFRISIPVFSTEKREGSYTFDEIMNNTTHIIQNYNNNLDAVERVSFVRKNKTQKKIIKSIDVTQHSIGDNPFNVPVLLLQVHTYNINILEGFTEDPNGERKDLGKMTKLGSEHNYILLYPNLTGHEPNQMFNWLVLVYEDPNKTGTEIINTAKLVIGKILRLNMFNIKPIDVLNKLKTIPPVSVFEVKFTGITSDDNGVDERMRQYLYSTNKRIEKKLLFKDLPFDLIEDFVASGFSTDQYQKRETKIISGKNEYRLKKSVDDENDEEDEQEFANDIQRQAHEARALFKETAEQVFTDSFTIFEADLERVYNREFIVEKLSPIIHNYIASYNA